jgi:hypothetical protein
MLARLAAKPLVGFEQVSVRGPSVCRAARHLTVSKVLCGGLAVLRGEVELCGCLVAQPGSGLEGLAQFQTLTSR